jgi:hypothetical protein
MELSAKSLKGVREQELKNFPDMFRHHPGCAELRNAVKGTKGQRKQMLQDIGEAAAKEELAATTNGLAH